jgi:hypothetical protein
MLAVLPAASASASVVYDHCTHVQSTQSLLCHYLFTGEGATPAAAEADAAAYDPACAQARLVTGPEQLASGQWYVEYSESCAFD